jgi:PAS domain S-box-containing protein
MHETKQSARNILILVNAIIASGSVVLKIIDPIVVSYTEDIRSADLLNFLVFTPIIMIVLSLLLHRAFRPIVLLSALGTAMTSQQAGELRTAAFNLPLRVLFLFNLVILSIVAFVALGFDALVFPFYPFYKRLISMGLIWSYTVCSSLVVYVYVKRRMAPILRATSGLAADAGYRMSIKTTMVATTLTLSAMILFFLSVYGYSVTREALVRDDQEAANALLYSVKQQIKALKDLPALRTHLSARATGAPVHLVDAGGNPFPLHAPGGPGGNALSNGAEGPAGDSRLMKLLPLDAPFEGLFLATAYRTNPQEQDATRKVLLVFLVVGCFFLLFSGLISHTVAAETSAAIADIEKRMRRISEDKETLYSEFEVVSLDEVGDLTRSFNGLQQAIHRQNLLVKELEEKKHHVEKEKLRDAVDKATASLRESELKFRALAETTTAGIFIHRGGRIVYANPASETIAGYTNAEFLSRDFRGLFCPDDRVRESGPAYPEGGKPPMKSECRMVTKQGELRWATIATGSIEYEGKPAVIATVFDITDRKLAEEEKVNLYEQRIAEEKKHAREKQNILMDLHDGIGGITTNISILSEMARNASDLASVKKMLLTISQLSREGMLEIRSFMQSLDTGELTWRMLAAELRNQGARMTEPYRIAFTLSVSPEEIDDREERPESVLWVNLFKIYKEALTNVIKHSQASSVAVMLTLAKGGLQLIVRDDGIGCEAHRNSGRGLSTMQKRAEEVGGRVTVSAGSGTQVLLEIPLPLNFPAS